MIADYQQQQQQQENNKCHQNYEDMVLMKDLTEVNVLRNLKIRYNQDKIYTYISSILISVNPYFAIPKLYDRQSILKYIDVSRKTINKLQNPPHIFAVADMAYNQRRLANENQVMVISGESGSGKTESTKLILQYLAHVSGQHSWVEQQLIDSNPILEAFGNAKTSRNDNSSRFGKYIDVAFSQDGHIKLSKISHYLLEKSRIVHQDNKEQNYHIFYWLISGMSTDDLSELRLYKNEDFKYLTGRLSTCTESIKREKECWEKLLNAFRILNFNNDDLDQVFRILSAILHFGQLEFRNQPIKNSEHISTIKNPSALGIICEMLSIDKEQTIKALTNRTLLARNQTISTSIEAEQSSDVRDALARGLYDRLFNWVVNTINASIYINKCSSNDCSHIGVLDVFGFEDLSDIGGTCGFEQFCINYANEKLQQFFVKHVFSLEQEEYIREGMPWSNIDYVDNQSILNLIADTNMSLLALINEETIFPRSTDSSLCQKLQRVHSGRHSSFIAHPYGNVNMFGVRHFAGEVRYTTKRFLDKNRDSFSNDLLDLMFHSKSPFVRSLFDGLSRADTTGTWKKSRTLLSHFRRSLDQLIQNMSKARPYFIRCLRPNAMKSPRYFDSNLVMKQLRYSGIMSTIEIRRLGYPIRYKFETFLNTFYIFDPRWSKWNNDKLYQIVRFICEQALTNVTSRNFFIGKTTIYFKLQIDQSIEKWKSKKFLPSVILLQQQLKTRKIHKTFIFIRHLAIQIQRLGRQHIHNLLNMQTCDTSTIIDTAFKPILDEDDLSDFNKNSEHDFKFSTTNRLSVCKYKFVKFTKAYFTSSNDHKYTTESALLKPLLKHENKEDVQAALACWMVLQQLIHRGDIDSIVENSQIEDNCKNEHSNYTFKHNKYEWRQHNGSMMRRSKITPECMGRQNTMSSANPFVPRRKLSSLEQQHFIVGLGIVRPTLRDEIYCQIMKQLTGNSSKRSYARGWLLLANLLSTFVPSKLLFPYVEDFVKSGPGCLSEFCLQRLRRTKTNGNRHQPPSWLEMHATKMKRSYIPVGITLMDGSSVNINIDSASTSHEVVRDISTDLGLVDKFGFSVFIAALDKVTSLGSDSMHILDAVSNCEQYCKEKQNLSEKNSPWRLFFRKEMFAPWHNSSLDPVSTNLIYHQICRGVRYGEYRCTDQQSLYLVISKIFMIESGNIDSLDTFLPTLLPEEISNISEHIESIKPYVVESIEEFNSSLHLKEELVEFAKCNWPILFSRFFEARCEMHPDLPSILAINSSGLSIIANDANYNNSSIQLLHIAYPHILAVSANESSKCLFLHTTKTPTQPVKIYSKDSHAIRSLIVFMLNEMRKMSKYFVTTSSYPPHLNKGDLLELIEEEENEILIKTDSNEELRVPKTILHRLATVNRPNNEILNDFKTSTYGWPSHRSTPQQPHSTVSSDNNEDEVQFNVNSKLTLDEYRRHKFNRSNNVFYQNTPLSKPLLKQLSNNTSLEEKALRMFDLILHYSEHDAIFEDIESIIQIALNHPLLRDECYCQLLKQLNGSKGVCYNLLWQLLWMLTGCCAPYCPTLCSLVDNFLNRQISDTFIIPKNCLHRLHKTTKRGSRKFPPTHIEYEAIQKGTTQIFHRIFLPDGSNHVMEIESSSRAKDVCSDLMKSLQMLGCYPVNHFALYVNVAGRMVIVPPSEFFFDFLRSIMTLITKAPHNVTYQAMFRRKLWINVYPGYDLICDSLVHFAQERENFLKGYHNDQICFDDIVRLCQVLRLIAKKEDKSEIECFPLIGSASVADRLKRTLEKEPIVNNGCNDNLKLEFLNLLSKKSKLFGFTFFSVTCPNQKTLQENGELFNLAVGQNGVYLLNSNLDNKIVNFYPYKELTNWTSGSCYLHLTIGDLISGTKLLFETSLGYRIDDLLTSYVSVIIEQQLTGGQSISRSQDNLVIKEIDHI